MNFQAMRKDGYSDTDIVESLRSSELFRDTADFDGLRKKGFDDTKIIDFLDATPSFHEVTTARREKAKATQPTQTPIVPQNNEGDVEALGDTAVPKAPIAPAPDAPTMPAPKDDSFLGSIKQAGQSLLDSIFSTGKEIQRDIVKPIEAGMGNVIEGLSGGMLKNDTPLPSETKSAYALDEKDRAVSSVVESAKMLSDSALLASLFSNNEAVQKDTFDKVSKALQNTGLADDVEMDDKGQLFLIKDGKEYRVEDGFFKNLPSILEANANTIFGGVAGAVAPAMMAGSRALGAVPSVPTRVASVLSSATGSMLGAAADQYSASKKTGVGMEADHVLSMMAQEGMLSFVADGLVHAGGMSVKPIKDFITGDGKAYEQMISDFGVDEQFAKDAFNELNQMLEKPLEDSKTARMYAMSLKHQQGLNVLLASLYRNPQAAKRVENEIMNRSEQLKKLLDDKAITEGELDGFLNDAQEAASAQYQNMRNILRAETIDVEGIVDPKEIAQTLKSVLPKIMNDNGLKEMKRVVKLIENAPFLTETFDGLLETRHLINRRLRKMNITEDFTAPDYELVNGVIKNIDNKIHELIDRSVEPSRAKELKDMFEVAKLDYSKKKRGEASSFFKTLTKTGASHYDQIKGLQKGFKGVDETADFVLSHMTDEQRARLELTAIHESIAKNVSGQDGGVKAISFEGLMHEVSQMKSNMKSPQAQETIALLDKFKTLYSKDPSLLITSVEKDHNGLAQTIDGAATWKLITAVLKKIDRLLPTKRAADLSMYHRLGKYMETSHNTKQFALKMYNDPSSSLAEKAYYGKYIHYYNKNDSEGMNQLMQNPPEPPKDSKSNLMDEDEIDSLSQSGGKTPTAEELKARLDDEAKAFKPDDTNPPDDNGGGGSPKPKEGADNGVQGQKEALDISLDTEGVYPHYSSHEFDVLSTNNPNMGQTKGAETAENNTIKVGFVYKKGAEVEVPMNIGKAGQHEYAVDLRGKTFFDKDKEAYFKRAYSKLKDANPTADDATLTKMAQDELDYSTKEIEDIKAYIEKYTEVAQANPNLSYRDKRFLTAKELKYDGMQNERQIEFFDDAPVKKVRTLEDDVTLAGIQKRTEHLPSVTKANEVAQVRATIEATPSQSDELYTLLKGLSDKERNDYEKAHIPLVQELAKSFGLETEVSISKGAYLGKDGTLQNNPMMVVTVQGRKKTIKKMGEETEVELKNTLYGDGIASYELRDMQENIEAFLKAYGHGTNQDSVPWYAPIFKGSEEGRHVYFDLKGDIDQAQWEQLSKSLVGDNGALTPQIIDGQLRIMNFGGLPKAQRDELIEESVGFLKQSGVIDENVVQFESIGKLLEKGKHYGKRLDESANGTSGRPNISESTGGNHAIERFNNEVQNLRDRLRQRNTGTKDGAPPQRPELDKRTGEMEDHIGGVGGSGHRVGSNEEKARDVVKAGEQLAYDLKDAPASTFKGGYVRPEVLSFMTKTLTGATGGSLTEYDYNQDGKIDFKDRAIGAALGVVGFHALTSQPAFSAYKALAEHGIKQLETRAEQGDLVAQMALGTRYIYASGKAGEMGAFSDVLTKQTMKEIDDSGAKISFTYDAIPTTDRHILKQFEHYKNGELSQNDFEFYVSQRMNKELDALFNKRKNGEIDSFDYYKQRQSIEEKYFNIKVGDKNSGKLEDFLQHDTLYKEYPFLKEIDVSIKRISSSGYFDPIKKEIVIDSASKDKDTTLLHEIQHAIQTQEGLPIGGSPTSAYNVGDILSSLKRKVSDIEKEETALQKEYMKDYDDAVGKKLDDVRRWKQRYKEAIDEPYNNVSMWDEEGALIYKRLYGEQQARAVEYRKNMTPEQRAKESWQETLKREEGKYDEPIIRYGDGEMLSAVLTDKYMIDNTVNKEALLKDSLPFKDVAYTKANFAAQFGVSFGDTVTVKTPKGVPDITIDTLSQFHKLNPKNYKDDRRILVGIINDLLTDPLFVVEHNGARKFFGVFDDKKDGIYAISVSEKKGQLDVLSSNYRPLKNRKVDWRTIKNLMKVPDGDVLYVRGGEKL